MKTRFLLFAMLILNYIAIAQQTEKIPGYAKDQRPMSWYKQQIKLNEAILQKNPKDESAWFNDFKATRIILRHDTTDKRDASVKDEDLKKLVDRMGLEIPNSYSYNFAKWELGGNDMSLYPYLEKAIDIDPNRTDHFEYMVNMSELTRDIKQRDIYSNKLINANLLSSGMMYYNYNTMIGLSKNAILLTSGDNDSYPTWALQAKGIRKDVHVLNMYLLQIKSYREKVFTELGIPQIDMETKEEKEKFNKKIIQLISENKKKYPVYVALTTAGCEEYLTDIENNLYLTGLAYQYDTASFDNMAVLRNNFEQRYALDYLDKVLYTEISREWVSMINQNYLVPMMKLYSHYKESGDVQKQQWMKEKILLLAKDSAEQDTILKYVNE